MNIIDAIVTPATRSAFRMFTSEMSYQPQGALAPAVVRGFLRRLNPQELLAAAIQQGALLVIDADHFVTVVGNATPRKYDRVVSNGTSYAVERWDASVVSGVPTLFKVTLLGGQQ